MGTMTMNISLPDALKRYVDEQVDTAGYGSTSEYMRDLIRQDQQRRAADKLAALIADGLASGPAVAIDADYFARKRKLIKSSS